MARRKKVAKYRQGIYKPRNPEKNVNKTPVEYRSQLEFEYMFLIDNSPKIKRWGSEVVWVPYRNPVKKRVCQYWTDLYLETVDHGILVVEIKPEKEIKAILENKVPKQTKNKKKSTYIYQMTMFAINQAKWKAATEYCNKKGWKFIQVSEKDLKEKRVPFL